MAGAGDGVPEFTLTITITVPRMKSWASSPARVRVGGEDGAIVEVHAGDVVVIPAGVAHKSEGASPDLLVVGAYPGGHGPDMRVPGAAERERALAKIAAVPLPAADPVCGGTGPLLECWGAAARH
jgi:uncharacterized protein YjlB